MPPSPSKDTARRERVEYRIEVGDFGWKQFLLIAFVVPFFISSPLLIFVAIYELVGAVL
jgi:hypothetical protein